MDQVYRLGKDQAQNTMTQRTASMHAVRGKPAENGRGCHAKNKTGDMPHEQW